MASHSRRPTSSHTAAAAPFEWTPAARVQLLALHALHDASSPRFWSRIAAALGASGLPGVSAGECQRQWQSILGGDSPTKQQRTPSRKRQQRGQGQEDDSDHSEEEGGAGSSAPQQQQQGRKRAKQSASTGAASSSPAAAATAVPSRPPAPRPRAPKPTLRELFELHRASGVGTTAPSGSSHEEADEDDFFEASPFKAARQREEQRLQAGEGGGGDTCAAAEDGAEAEGAEGDEEQADPEPAPSPTPATRTTRSAGRGAKSRPALKAKLNAKKGSPTARSLLQHLRASAAAGIAEDDIPITATHSAAAADVDESVFSSASALLSSQPERAKTDAYVRSFQRSTKQQGALAMAAGKSKKGAAAAAGTSKSSSKAQAPSLSLASQSALRAALRAQDARSERRAQRALDAADESDDSVEDGMGVCVGPGARRFGVGGGGLGGDSDEVDEFD